MKNFKKFIFVLSISVLPMLTFAASSTTCSETVTDIGDVLCKIGNILNMIIPVLVVLGIVYFIWGIVSYVIGDEEEAKKKGKNRIIYGLIGFVVISALEGLVTIVIDTFGFETNTGVVSEFIQKNSALTGTGSLDCALADSPKLGDLLGYVTCLIYGSIIPLIVALAVVIFVWGVVQYVINDQEEAKRQKGKQFMIWGIIGLTVMVAVWGLVNILGSTFGINYAIPQLQ